MLEDVHSPASQEDKAGSSRTGARSHASPDGRPAEAAHCAAIEALGPRLDSGELVLKRGKRGEMDKKWACRSAGISLDAPSKYRSVDQKIQDLAIGREFGPDPERAVRNKMAAATMLNLLDLHAAKLTPLDRLAATPGGALCRSSLAKRAGIPGDQWRGVGIVEARMLLIGEEHGFGRAAQPPEARDKVVARFKAYDSMLEASGGRVPSYRGKPSVGAAAPIIGIAGTTISHSADYRALLDVIAKRHGLRRIDAARSRGGDRLDAVDALVDEAETYVLRGECFPVLEGDRLDHSKLLDRLQLNPDIVTVASVRRKMSSLHQEVLRAVTGRTITDEQLLEHDNHAVVDRYESYVLAGIQIPPVKADGEADLAAVERLYGLTIGATRRFPSIGARIRAIRAPSQDHDEQAEKARAGVLQLVLASLSAHDAKLGASGKCLPSTELGEVSHMALERSLGLRTGSISAFDEAVAAVQAMVKRHGVGLYRPGNYKTHPLDADVTEYIQAIRARGIGAPRRSPISDRVCAVGIAEEICNMTGRVISPGDLTRRHINDIRKASAEAQLGPVSSVIRAPSPRGAPSAMALDNLDRSLAAFAGPLPGDPTDGRFVDVNAISMAALIEVRVLMTTPEYLPKIDDWAIKVGIRPFVHHAQTITLEALIAHGRERRAKESSGKKPGEAVSRTVKYLTNLMDAKSVGINDTVGTLLDPERTDGAVETEDLRRWRRYHAELMAAAALPKDLATSLKVLMHKHGLNASKLHARVKSVAPDCISLDTLEKWTNGRTEPTFAQQDALDALETIFGLTPATLTDKISKHHRQLGKWKLEGCEIPKNFHPFVPRDYYLKEKDEQEEILVWIAENVLSQNLPQSHRHRVVQLDRYRLPFKRWPEHLQAEWTAYLKSREPDDGLDFGSDVHSNEDDDRRPLANGGKPYRVLLESEAWPRCYLVGLYRLLQRQLTCLRCAAGSSNVPSMFLRLPEDCRSRLRLMDLH